MITPAERRTLHKGRTDPVWWVRTALGIEPWRVQQEVLESVRDHRRTAVRSCHAIGKSTVAACAVLWFVCNFSPCLVLTTATSHRQVRGILWREIRRLHRDAKMKLGGRPTQTELTFGEDWYAWGFTAPEYDATKFQGFHSPNIMVVVDEAAGVQPLVYEGLDSAMSSGHARMLEIGNPTRKEGDFGKAFDTKDVSKFVVSAFDSPNFTKFGVTLDDIRHNTWRAKQADGELPYPFLISPEWVYERWIRWCGGRISGEDDPRWQGRVMAEFPDTSDDALIPMHWLDLAVERWHDLEEEEAWRRTERIGVDVARLGPDTTVSSRGPREQGVRLMQRAPKSDTMQTAGWVLFLLSESPEFAVEEVRIDGDGLGAGVYDRCNEQQPRLMVEMRGGMRAANPERFANARSEWCWQVREALDPAGENPIALPPDDNLASQASQIKWKLNSRGQVQVESKEDMRKRGLGSPDEFDSVVYWVADMTGEFDPEEHLLAMTRM